MHKTTQLSMTSKLPLTSNWILCFSFYIAAGRKIIKACRRKNLNYLHIITRSVVTASIKRSADGKVLKCWFNFMVFNFLCYHFSRLSPATRHFFPSLDYFFLSWSENKYWHRSLRSAPHLTLMHNMMAKYLILGSIFLMQRANWDWIATFCPHLNCDSMASSSIRAFDVRRMDELIEIT